MAIQTNTLRKYATRLEQQTSNFQESTDIVQYDLNLLCDIFKGIDTGNDYTDPFAAANSRLYNPLTLSSQAAGFSEGWNNARNGIKADTVRIAAGMLGFYEATSANEAMGAEKLKELADRFSQFYSQNPNLAETLGISSINSNQYWQAGGQANRGTGKPNYGNSPVIDWSSFH